MAYEAMNNAEAAGNRLVVILNDNDMSIAPPVGGLSALSRAAGLVGQISDAAPARPAGRPQAARARSTHGARAGRGISRAASATGGTLFEELGFYYVGPVDGHNVERLVKILENVRDADEGPMLVHVVTKKGKGYAPGRGGGRQISRRRRSSTSSPASRTRAPAAARRAYQNVFGETLAKLGRDATRRSARSPRRCRPAPASTSSPPRIPDRAFDVGIAEQHAVTFAAGLAAQGMRPFCAIYSTFLQRAYDQVVHDVAIQNLPVRFAIDRAGLVGADGATHAGSFDVTYLCDPAQFRGDGGRRRGRARAHGPHHGAARQRADRGPLSARQRHRRGAAGDAASGWRSARAGSSARARRSRSSRSAPGSPRR